MPTFVLRILVIAALCATATACVPRAPASPSMFFGNCITPMGPDPCGDDMSICQAYETVVTGNFTSAGACRSACNQEYMRLANQYEGSPCGAMLDRGSDLCEQQCLRLYPAVR